MQNTNYLNFKLRKHFVFVHLPKKSHITFGKETDNIWLYMNLTFLISFFYIRAGVGANSKFYLNRNLHMERFRQVLIRFEGFFLRLTS